MNQQALLTLDQLKRINDVLEFCRSPACEVQITTEDEYRGAGALVGQLKKLYKALDEDRADAKAPHIEAGRKIDSEYRDPMAVVQNKVRTIEDASRAFRKRIEEEAERARIAAQKKADEERRRLEAKADKAEEKGKVEKAEELRMAAATTVAAPVATATVPKNVGRAFNTRVTYEAQVTDLPTFVRHCLDSQCTGLLIPDMVALNKMARALGNQPSPYPGVVFISKGG